MRMINLRETVAEAIHAKDAKPGGLTWAECNHGYYLKAADAALAALGLDDLDAAVERAMNALLTADPSLGSVTNREVRASIEAALLAAEGSQDV